MSSNMLDMLSREEAASRFSARRARLLVFTIENRTAHLVLQVRRASRFNREERGSR